MATEKRFADGGIDIPMTKGDRKLVWCDCFNGKKIDPEIWTTEFGKCSDILEGKSEKDICLKDGRLYLTSYDNGDGTYTAPSALITRDRFEFLYGYFEAKGKLAFYNGNSSAIWFRSTEVSKKGYKNEIDAVELLGRTDNVVANLHIWGPTHNSFDGSVEREDRSHTFTVSQEELLKEEHTYAMDWTPDYIDFSVDGEVYCHADLSEKGESMFREGEKDMDAFRMPVFFILSEYLYTKGRGMYKEGALENMPYTMSMDYVALYQREGEKYFIK